jgi:hypothetical protein
MPRLHTPRDVLQQAYLAASADKEAPDGGMQLLREVTARITQRGLMDVWMSHQSVEDLLEEETEAHFRAQAAELAHVQGFESH